jgi:YD repeat-containing protein
MKRKKGNEQIVVEDLKGNLQEDGSNTYTYDTLNQQIGMTGPGGTAEYVYDALGRRVAKIVNGVATYFVYNAFSQALEERDGSNQLLARYTTVFFYNRGLFFSAADVRRDPRIQHYLRLQIEKNPNLKFAI